MTEKQPQSSEAPKSIFDWLLKFKNAVLAAVGVHALSGAVLAYDWQEAATHAPREKTHQEATDLIEQIGRVKEITTKLEAKFSERIDDAIDLYLDPEAPGYTGKVAPVGVYLELEAFKKAIFELKHLAARSSPGTVEDYLREVEDLTAQWQAIYDEKLELLLAKDALWTGDPVQDFPVLRRLMYEDKEAFFSPAEGIDPLYAAEAHSANEQLVYGELNCTSARFTYWLLQGIYEDRGLDTSVLKNLKNLIWDDHITSAYKGEEGLMQLQEMDDSAVRVQKSALSPETGVPGVARGQRAHLATELDSRYVLNGAQIDCLSKLGLLDARGPYFLGEIPLTGSLKEAKETPAPTLLEKETPSFLAWAKQSTKRSILSILYEEDWSWNNGSYNDFLRSAPLVLVPPTIKQPSMCARLEKNILTSMEYKGTDVSFDLDRLTTFKPTSGARIMQQYRQSHSLQELYDHVITPLGANISRARKAPMAWAFLEAFAKDPIFAEKLDRYFKEVIETVIKEEGSLSGGFILNSADNIHRWRTIYPQTALPEVDESIFLKKAAEEARTVINKHLKIPLKPEEIWVGPTVSAWWIDVDFVAYLRRLPEDTVLDRSTIDISLIDSRHPLKVYGAILSTGKKTTPEYKHTLQNAIILNEHPEEIRTEPYKTYAKEALNDLVALGEITSLEILYLGWDKIHPLDSAELMDDIIGDKSKDIIDSFNYRFGGTPSRSFYTTLGESYLVEGTVARRELLLQLSRISSMALSPGQIYPEDMQWIQRQSSIEGLRLRFYYDNTLDIKTLTDEELIYLDVGQSYNMKISEQSYDRLEELWKEMERRKLVEF